MVRAYKGLYKDYLKMGDPYPLDGPLENGIYNLSDFSKAQFLEFKIKHQLLHVMKLYIPSTFWPSYDPTLFQFARGFY